MKHDVDEVFRDWAKQIAAGEVPEGTTVVTEFIPKPQRFRIVMPGGNSYEFDAWEEDTPDGKALRISGDITIKPAP